jgi:chemotaxis protein CheD
MEQIVVGVGECAISGAPEQVLATYGLGSCIALAVYDPVTRVGGLAHFMLPDSAIDSGQRRGQPCAFADIAIPLLLQLTVRQGADMRRLRAYAAGAAQMIGSGPVFEIGRRNYEALLRGLRRADVPLEVQAVGGAVSRNLRLAIGTGRVRIWESGERHADYAED